MPTSVSTSVFTEITNTITELENLTSKPSLNAQEQRRNSFLLAKLSALKAGISPEQIRNHERESLLKEAGLAREPERARTKLGEEIEQEYRNWILGRSVRPTYVPSDRDVETRANISGTQSISYTEGASGGYFVSPGMWDRFLEVAKQYDQLFDSQFHNSIDTDTGAVTPAPAFNDVTNSSVQVGEAQQSSEVDVFAFGTVQLAAYTFRSKKIAISIELANDINFNLGAVIERVFAMRHARGVGASLVNGTGVNAPTGLLTATVASGVSPVIASGSSANTGGSETGATSIGTADINSLLHKLDPAYRWNSVFVMNDSTLSYLEGLVNKLGGYLVSWFRDGLGTPNPYILGRPVCISPSMPSIGAATNPVVIYDPDYFLVRTVPSAMYLRAYREAPGLVENGLIGLESMMRVDSNLLAPNSQFAPAQYLQCHS